MKLLQVKMLKNLFAKKMMHKTKISKNRRVKSIIAYLILGMLYTILFPSCGLYRQNITNTPLFEKRGDIQVGGHMGFTGYDGQIGWAFTKNLSMVANYSNSGIKETKTSTTNYSIFRHYFFETGGGYFFKNKKNVLCNFLVLGGKGMSYNFVTGGDHIPGHTLPFTEIKQVEYNRIHITSNWGRKNRKWAYILSPGLFYLHYYHLSDTQSITDKALPKDYLFADLALILQYHFLKHLKVSGQVNLTAPLTDFKHSYYEFSPINISLGIILDIHFNKKQD